MPQASDELRGKMKARFGTIDCHLPLKFLQDSGWTEKAGWLFSPNRVVAEGEWERVDFLCDEWDFAYDAAKITR